jgi:hypothetical protein
LKTNESVRVYYSQEVKGGTEIVIRLLDLVLLGIGAELVSVHAHHWNLDRAGKVEVVVAEMIGRSLKLLLVHAGGVIDRSIKYRLSSGDCGLVRNQVEIKKLVALVLNNGCVDNCAWARVQEVLVGLREQTVLNVSVNETIEDLRLVTWRSVLQKISNHVHFKLLYLSSKSGTTHTVSVDNNLLRKVFVVFLELTHRLIDELLENI